MHNECRPLQGHCTGHWVEAATSPHTTASIINLVHLCPDNQYDSSIEILYLVHKESLFIFLTSQNKHLFVCLYYPHIGTAGTGPYTGHYTGLGRAYPGQWQQSQQILFIRELRPSLACRVSCSAAVSRTPSHAGAGVCVMSCLHAEKCGTIFYALYPPPAPGSGWAQQLRSVEAGCSSASGRGAGITITSACNYHHKRGTT